MLLTKDVPEDFVIQQMKRKGMAIPEILTEEPELWPGLELYLTGFLDISYDRPMGMGFGPISWFTVEKYADIQEWDDEQKEAFHYHVRGLDQIWLEHHNKKED